MKAKTLFKIYAVGYLIAITISFCLYFHTLYVSQGVVRIVLSEDTMARYKDIFATKEFLLINFWTIECKSCNVSMRSFDDVLDKYGNDLEIWSAAVESPRHLEVARNQKNSSWNFMPPKHVDWRIVDVTEVQDVANSLSSNNNLVDSYLLIHKSRKTLIGSGNSLFQIEKILSNGGFPAISLFNAIQTVDYKIAFMVITGSYTMIALVATIFGWIFFKVVKKKNIY